MPASRRSCCRRATSPATRRHRRRGARRCATSGLRVTGFQVLRDFEGLSGHLHDYKIDVAKSMLEMCARVGATVLLVCSSTSTHATDDRDAIARDLRKLAMLALPLGIKVAYEGLSWGRTINEFPDAWDIVCRADMPNLGIGIDSFHAFATKSSLDDLDMLSPDKIFLVQLADFMWQEMRSVEERITTARHFRVFPGEGVHSEALAELVTRLDALGYRGDYSFEVFNDDYSQMPLPTVAERARRSAIWLGEDVLRRSVPLPNQIRLRERRDVASPSACIHPPDSNPRTRWPATFPANATRSRFRGDRILVFAGDDETYAIPTRDELSDQSMAACPTSWACSTHVVRRPRPARGRAEPAGHALRRPAHAVLQGARPAARARRARLPGRRLRPHAPLLRPLRDADARRGRASARRNARHAASWSTRACRRR